MPTSTFFKNTILKIPLSINNLDQGEIKPLQKFSISLAINSLLSPKETLLQVLLRYL